jgi:N-acetylglucosaminyldiphosphoundecaprenol N-acetyl-beta-D-mannosaminyltransferase
MKDDIKCLYIAGIKFHNITKQEFKNYLHALPVNPGKNINIVTPNVDFVARASNDTNFKEIINCADWSVCDSAIIYKCSKLLSSGGLKDKITGFDAMTSLLEIANQRKEKIFLLGSTDDTVNQTADNIRVAYPGLGIAGCINGFFDVEKDSLNIIRKINESGAKYLFIGMGSPRQEKWAHEHKDKLHVNCVICVGGLFDIYSGKIKRAPVFMQHIGMEWFWRFINDPRRLFKRYFIEDMKFFLLLLRQIFGR